jgi:halogenation protein CepH
MTQEEFEVVVAGGGPAGSTVATLVAMHNHRVLLLERERFPRYQIGESLLPATVHGICVMLGVAEQLKEANFVRKLGGTFRWGARAEPWTFAFGISSAMTGSTAYAYQVERAKFDKILLDNAAHKGVDVRQEHRVTELIKEGERVTGVRFVGPDGVERVARARFVVDATGNQSLIGRVAGERVFSKFFQNLALFCYFENGKRLPPPNSGNILSVAFDSGWFWYIPLSETLTSVGAVISKEHAAQLRDAGGYEEAMRRFIASCPLIAEYLAGARRVTEGIYGQFRVRKDYSYCHSSFWYPGLVLVGDAACFVDPVFSSGVHLATYSGLLAARSINSTLRGDLDEELCFREFELRYRKEYGNFYNFLVEFYDMNREWDSYFWTARHILNTEERSNEAFVRLVAGVSTTGEPLYNSADEFFRARERASAFFPDSKDELETGEQSSILAGDVFSEAARIQLQASLGANSRLETPLFSTGLVPSTDGLRWRKVKTAAAE